MKVLVLTPDEKAIPWFRDFFEGRGHKIQYETSYRKAINAYKKMRFFLVAVDGDPKDRGVGEFYKTIRESRASHEAHVLALAEHNGEHLDAFVKAGASDYLVKGSAPETLHARLLFTENQAKALETRSESWKDLRKAEEKYRSLLELTNDGVAVIEDKKFQLVSQQLVDMLGYAAEEMVGATFMDFIDKNDIPEISYAYERHMSGERNLGVFEVSARRKDGSRVQLQLNSGVIEEEEGPAELVFIRDVTEQKKTLDALKENERQYKLLAENIIDIIGTISLDLRFTYVSPSVKRQTGFEVEDIVGKPIAEFLPPESYELVARSLREELEKDGRPGVDPNRRRRFDIEIRTRDGSEKWVEVTGSLLRDADGKVVGYMGIVRDIGDRKKALDALRRNEEHFRHGQKMEAVSRLAGGVAHDFNNLLTVILSHCDLASMDVPAQSKLRGDLEGIRKAAMRAASLTNQLLMFSSRQAMEKKTLDLNVIVADQENTLSRAAGEGIQVLTLLDPSLGRIQADEGRLAQVIMSLAVNARDAMPRGGRLTIETSNVFLDEETALHYFLGAAGNYVCLRVNDTGHGMDEATLSHVFEPFFTTKTSDKGSGLGLSIVYGIVKQSGGSIIMESAPDQGTTCRIYFPCCDAADQAAHPQPPVRRAETVLLVEDEEMVRQLAIRILKPLGYEILEARDARQAFKIQGKHPGNIGLIITDIVMPGTNGYELAEQISRVRPDTKFLFMSGFVSESIERAGFPPSKAGFLKKPFTPDELTHTVRTMLDMRPEESEPAN